ncbi:MAG: histidine phosphatase family protein [Candidatus Aenigmarchaeota archaeon]|nr:histidine phosphatase family protein [Candidatus Aenigmarchaeota archaeon]
MKTTVILIRHGHSGANLPEHSELIRGRTFLPDADLTDMGRQQIDYLIGYLRSKQYDWSSAAIYSSPIKRAALTSRRLCTNLDILPQNLVEIPELTEIGQGIWNEKPRTEVYSPKNMQVIRRFAPLFRPPGNYPSNLDSIYADDSVINQEFYSNGGESIADVSVRSNSYLRSVLDRQSHNIVLLVTHLWPLKTLLSYGGRFGSVDETSIAIKELQDGKPVGDIKRRYLLGLELAMSARRFKIPHAGCYMLEWDHKRKDLELDLTPAYIPTTHYTY